MAKANHTPLVTPVAARRGVLLGALMSLAGSKTTVAAAPAPDTVQSVDAAADALTASLTRLHGGKWSTTVNHELGFVLIMMKGGAQ